MKFVRRFATIAIVAGVMCARSGNLSSQDAVTDAVVPARVPAIPAGLPELPTIYPGTQAKDARQVMLPLKLVELDVKRLQKLGLSFDVHGRSSGGSLSKSTGHPLRLVDSLSLRMGWFIRHALHKLRDVPPRHRNPANSFSTLS
jgi:hypothetical protein